MKHFGLVILLLAMLFSACNQGEINNLHNQIYELEQERDHALQRVAELENELLFLSDKVFDLEEEVYELEAELQVCEFSYEQYKEGQGICVTRYWKDIGRRTICGAENIMDMYKKGYCIWDCKYNPDY
jgi:septal ring factor EnvC (AmiA/AmiB activator)